VETVTPKELSFGGTILTIKGNGFPAKDVSIVDSKTAKVVCDILTTTPD
jgi:hypothetical protein